MKNIFFLINFIYISVMSQESYKISKRDQINPLEYSFYDQNPQNLRICTKNNTKESYYVMAANSKYVILLDNKNMALDITLSNKPVDLNGLLETELQEEIEKIDQDNINVKSKEILNRFNKKFNLNVTFDPSKEDVNIINDNVKKTVWNKENTFLLNFYMMTVFKLKYNIRYKFKKVETFNPFLFVCLDDGFEGTDFYRYLRSSDKKIYDFNNHIERLERMTRKWTPLNE
ncbi:hypothetical protein [Chryseobacterium scophthalmum]|uniref:hypothetical protein n=1 Tax=Chryseobacterium scophthalmum TaxID=59733 RepID=UPI003D001485